MFHFAVKKRPHEGSWPCRGVSMTVDGGAFERMHGSLVSMAVGGGACPRRGFPWRRAYGRVPVPLGLGAMFDSTSARDDRVWQANYSAVPNRMS